MICLINNCGREITAKGRAAHERMSHPATPRDPTVRLPLAVPGSLADAVEARAKVDSVSVAEIGRRALTAYLGAIQ